MKGIVLKVIVLLAVVVQMDGVFRFMFEKHIFQRTLSGERAGSLNYLIQKKQHSAFIVMGSSRAKNHIDPAQLTHLKGTGYNAAINGAGALLYNSVLLELMLSNHVKPNTILLQTDVNNFSTDAPESHISELTPLYPYYQQSYFMQHYIKSLRMDEHVKLYSSMYRFNGKAMNILFNYLKRNSVTENNGYMPLFESMDTMGEPFTAYSSNTVIEFSKIKLEAMKNIIQLCSHNDIRLIIVLPPSYNNVIYGSKDIVHLKSTLKNISDRIRVIDMGDVKKFTDLEGAENWKDELHLNAIGAKKFSIYLNDSLK